MGTVRIIAGKWRGRKITFPDVSGLRPTPDRIRETLFNWLAPVINNATCLDLFGGSGALSFEAISRGARSVVTVEASATIIKQLRANAVKLGAVNITFIGARVPQQFEALQLFGKFDVVFLDPPFYQNLIQPICFQLEQTGVLAENSWIYLETESPLMVEDLLPPEWQIVRCKKAGKVRYSLARRVLTTPLNCA